MDRPGVRVLVYAALLGLAWYLSTRPGGPAPVRAVDSLSGQILSPDSYTLLTDIRRSLQAGGAI